MSSAQVSAALAKEKHPETFCPERRCLWQTGDGSRCPRHGIREKPRNITSYPKPGSGENRETRFPRSTP